MLDIIVLSLLTFLAVVYLSYEYFEHKTSVPTFPTMPAVRRKMIDLLKADAATKPNRPYVVYDLGSGSGQLCFHVAREMPDAKVIGVELSLIPYWRSVWRQKRYGVKNLDYRRVDFWPFSVADADAVVTYLPGKIMDRVGEKLRDELKAGALILANVFYLRAGWEPIETIEMRSPFKTNLYIYRR